jgi:flagellar M-ring protein FliF
MTEKLKQIPKQFLALWNKYSGKQKTIIISVISTIIIALIFLVVITGQTKYEDLTICKSTEDAATVAGLLKKEGIAYRLGADKVTVSVDKKRYSDAVLLIASKDMPSQGLSVDTLLNNSLSTTNSDRTLKLNLFVQNQLSDYLSKMEGVEQAQVNYIPVESSNSILTKKQETSASVLLKVNDNFKQDTAKTIAVVVASVIGNKTTDNIKVADQNGNLLFGGEQDLYNGSAASNEDYKQRLRNTFINNLYAGLIENGYDDAKIMPNLAFNMDKVTQLYTQYLPAAGQDQGLFKRTYTYDSENGSSSGGTAGTSANDETDYMTQDTKSGNGTVKSNETEYQPNKKDTNTEFEVGAVIPEKSSISIVLTKVITYKQEDLEANGSLKNTTFEQYALKNGNSKKIKVDNDIVTMVSKATGIPVNGIQIMAYERPVFVPKAVVKRSWKDYVPIILVVLIVALLAFVVFKSMSPVNVTELEPELSVEQLLATTKENQPLEDIEYTESSDVHRVIEKFVDEKPEAVAQLLRNWLNDDWN